MKAFIVTTAIAALATASGLAAAQPAAAEPPAGAAVAPAPKPAPYSLPWQLRPAAAASVVRSDTAVGFYKSPAGDGGSTVASTLLGSYKLTPELAPLVRLAYAHSSPPAGDAGSVLGNPLVGATYALKLGSDLRLAFFLGVTVPVGQGGGDTPDKAKAAALKAAMSARSAMDNTLFAVNDAAVVPGVDLAWVAGGLTVQVEATLFQLARVRGSAVQPDSSKTNFTTGLHVGYFVIPALSIGAEIRHQRWLSTPAAVAADPTGATRDNTTFAIGPRAHFQLGDSIWFRPGIAYARGVDNPMSDAKYQVVQVDLPLAF